MRKCTREPCLGASPGRLRGRRSRRDPRTAGSISGSGNLPGKRYVIAVDEWMYSVTLYSESVTSFGMPLRAAYLPKDDPTTSLASDSPITMTQFCGQQASDRWVVSAQFHAACFPLCCAPQISNSRLTSGRDHAR